jgi:ribosomal protein S18 acetylase RimI-like enzyme
MKTVPLDDVNLDAAISFITRLNQIKAHSIGYLSQSVREIAADVTAIQAPDGYGFIMVSDLGQLIGLLGLEFDIELGRSWLYGPLVEYEDWDAIADQLYEAVMATLPSEIRDQEIYCHKENIRVQEFARRQGFIFYSEGAVLTLGVGEKGYLPNSNSLKFVEEYTDQFIVLHARLFPNTYYSGEQLIKLAEDDDKHLFVHLLDDNLVGYTFIQGREAYRDGYIDFLGVDEQFRHQGIGMSLISSALNWFFQLPYVEKVTLTVNTENTTAMAIYQGLGFKIESVSQAYRRK